MNADDRKFLEDALKSMTLDVIEELTKAMRTLTEGNASEDDQVVALEIVTNFVEDMDTANGEKFRCLARSTIRYLWLLEIEFIKIFFKNMEGIHEDLLKFFENSLLLKYVFFIHQSLYKKYRLNLYFPPSRLPQNRWFLHSPSLPQLKIRPSPK
jgi:hypothetical protein